MSRLVAAAVLLILLPATAYADGLLIPGYRHVRINYTFTVEQDYPDYDFYLVTTFDSDAASRVTISPSAPLRVSFEDRMPPWANLFAVKKTLRSTVGEKPSDDWLRKHEGKGVGRVQVPLDWGMGNYLRSRKTLPFTDNRECVELVCRIEKGPDGWRLVKVSENAGNPWVRRAWFAGGIFTAVGFIWLGIWLLRRLFRYRSHSQPPRGENISTPFEGG